MTDHLTPKKRSWNMSRIHSKDTKPELKVRKFLYKTGFRYRLHNKNVPGNPDLSNLKRKVAIFVNGCFWHRHHCKKATMPKTNSQFWDNKFKRTVERDKNNYNTLKLSGWKTIVIWECEVQDLNILNKKFTGII